MSMCACMGPQGNDPLCPCRMVAAGLKPTPIWTPQKKEELLAAFKEIVEREDQPANA